MEMYVLLSNGFRANCSAAIEVYFEKKTLKCNLSAGTRHTYATNKTRTNSWIFTEFVAKPLSIYFNIKFYIEQRKKQSQQFMQPNLITFNFFLRLKSIAKPKINSWILSLIILIKLKIAYAKNNAKQRSHTYTLKMLYEKWRKYSDVNFRKRTKECV